MKQTFRYAVQVMLFFVLYTLSVSLIPAFLYYQNLISHSVYRIFCLSSGVFLYGLCGLFLAVKIQKKVLLQALVFLGILLVSSLAVSVSFHEFSPAAFCLRILFYLGGVFLVISHR